MPRPTAWPRHPTPVRPPTGRASYSASASTGATRVARRVGTTAATRVSTAVAATIATTGQSGTAGQTNVPWRPVAAGSSGIEPSSDCAPAQP